MSSKCHYDDSVVYVTNVYISWKTHNIWICKENKTLNIRNMSPYIYHLPAWYILYMYIYILVVYVIKRFM